MRVVVLIVGLALPAFVLGVTVGQLRRLTAPCECEARLEPIFRELVADGMTGEDLDLLRATQLGLIADEARCYEHAVKSYRTLAVYAFAEDGR